MASTNGLPVPALSSANNPPADFLALANAVDAAYGGSVANWAALPATGNFAGKRLWVSDIKVVATWNGTGWVQALPVSSTGISAADKASTVDSLGVGLVNVVPTSVAQAGGSASANAQGLVTFTGVTSLSLNGVFTSAYENYLVSVKINSATVNAGLRFRLRVSGTDQTGNYNWGGAIGASSGATQGFNSSGTTFAALGDTSNQTAAQLVNEVAFFSPQASMRTLFSSKIMFDNGTNVYGGAFGGSYQPTTQCDGFSLFLSGAGNFSGTTQVFGYNS